MTEKMTNEELANLVESYFSDCDPVSYMPNKILEEVCDSLRAMSWRPISEAPKDGRRVILVTVYQGGQSVGEGWYRRKPTEGWVYSMDANVPKPYATPTHFMFLPRPPEPTDD